MKPYDHKKIEKKWQKIWDEKKVYQTLNAAKAKAKKMKPFYVLDMFPYPSGSGLHVGHPRGYIASDVFARMKRMQGFNVLHPMGFDSFGLPAEQYAIATGKNPGPFTNQLVKRYQKQLEILGFSFDWSRQVATHDPEYYKWTQWIFLKIYESWYDKSVVSSQKSEGSERGARPIVDLIKIFQKSGNENVNAVCDESVMKFSAVQWKNFSAIEQQNILMKYRLAYEGYSEVNWCPEMGTVLANDEIVEKDGKLVSERGEFPVEKKSMRQWFMRITAYADRLISGLDGLDWSDHIKEIQKNWIGKSEGSEIEFAIINSDQKIKVFTTRSDTLFGVTYVVLAPEHGLVSELKSHIKNWDEVQKYITDIKNKSEADRTDGKSEKTGVPLDGVFAVNPANGEQVPVWVADYVLANYGTGAVMAVPAHDERDFEFANTFNLPLRQVCVPQDAYKSVVVAPTLESDTEFKKELQNSKIDFALATSTISGREHIRTTLSKAQISKFIELVQKYIKEGNWVEIVGSESIIVLKNDVHNDFLNHADHWFGKFVEWEPFVRGQKNLWDMLGKNPFLNEFVCFTDKGVLVNSGEFDGLTSDEAKKKITEFVGGKLVTKYKMRDAIFARQRYWGEPIPLVHQNALVKVFFLNESLIKGAHKQLEKLSVNTQKTEDWGMNYFVELSDLVGFIKKAQSLLLEGPWYFDVSGNRKMICFKKKVFDLSVVGENNKAIDFAKSLNIPEEQLDWKVESNKKEEFIVPLSEKQLPLKLPNVKSYQPSGNGESPLSTVPSWVKSGYETNTMPGWAGSSWYFLRYADPRNKKQFADKKELDYWFGKRNTPPTPSNRGGSNTGGVDMYVGGAEHATGHLLYSRFWNKFLYDLGYVPNAEPFKALRNQGMIGGADGRKMSKRWGNVINPDDVVAQLGADTMRLYEAFMGPFQASLPWSTDGIVGARRFIERVWKMQDKIQDTKSKMPGNQKLQKLLHKTIKKVSDDITGFGFNTAVSAMMILMNEMEKSETISGDDFMKFLKILAPFAPHVTDELWASTGGKGSIHVSAWPKYDPKLVIDDTVTIGVQVNGKARAEIELGVDEDEASVQEKVLKLPEVQKWLDGKSVRKFIYVKGKIVSIVV